MNALSPSFSSLPFELFSVYFSQKPFGAGRFPPPPLFFNTFSQTAIFPFFNGHRKKLRNTRLRRFVSLSLTTKTVFCVSVVHKAFHKRTPHALPSNLLLFYDSPPSRNLSVASCIVADVSSGVSGTSKVRNAWNGFAKSPGTDRRRSENKERVG